MAAPLASECLARVPTAIRQALAQLTGAEIYLVGGYLRDIILGRPTHDLDLAVDGDAGGVSRSLADRLRGAFVVLDGERGTYRVALREPVDGIDAIDLTRLRAPAIEDDLRGRDFTINALALTVGAAERGFVDPTGGLADLEHGVVRAASPGAFVDDPVRLLRAVRFVVQLNFQLDAATADQARAAAGQLARTAAERMRDEFGQILRSERAADGVSAMHDLGLLFTLMPDLEASVGVVQPKEHYYDVFQHSVQTVVAVDAMLGAAPTTERWTGVVREVFDRGADWFAPLRSHLEEPLGEGRPRLVALKLAALLHDVSKPETKTLDPVTGRMRFFGHDDLGSRRAANLARNLRFSTREVQHVELLVREHLRPGMLAAPGEVPTRRALYRFARDLGDAAPDLLLLNLADHAAARGPRLERGEFMRHVHFVAWVLHMLYVESDVTQPPKLIDGNDVMRELGLPPGPAIGRLLDTVREAQAAGEVSTKDEALALARSALDEIERRK